MIGCGCCCPPLLCNSHEPVSASATPRFVVGNAAQLVEEISAGERALSQRRVNNRLNVDLLSQNPARAQKLVSSGQFSKTTTTQHSKAQTQIFFVACIINNSI